MINKKGTAGLNVLLSVVVMLFMIGLIVMIFSLMGGEVANATTTGGGAGASIVNESVFFTNGAGTQTSLGAVELSNVAVEVCLGLPC